jgi:hypothetical protein
VIVVENMLVGHARALLRLFKEQIVSLWCAIWQKLWSEAGIGIERPFLPFV